MHKARARRTVRRSAQEVDGEAGSGEEKEGQAKDHDDAVVARAAVTGKEGWGGGGACGGIYSSAFDDEQRERTRRGLCHLLLCRAARHAFMQYLVPVDIEVVVAASFSVHLPCG